MNNLLKKFKFKAVKWVEKILNYGLFRKLGIKTSNLQHALFLRYKCSHNTVFTKLEV